MFCSLIKFIKVDRSSLPVYLKVVPKAVNVLIFPLRVIITSIFDTNNYTVYVNLCDCIQGDSSNQHKVQAPKVKLY